MLFYPLLEFRTKPDLALKKLNLERLADNGDIMLPAMLRFSKYM
jgi:hypothetical protein